MTNKYYTLDNKFVYPFCFQRQNRGLAVPRQVFLEKLSSAHQRYNALESFRRQIEKSKAGLHHQPYTTCKKSVYLYRSIFLTTSATFLILSLFAFSLPSTIHTGLFLGSLTTVKSVVIGLCSMLSLASLTIGIVMQAEKEAVYQSIKRAKARLSRSCQGKILKIGFKRHLFFGNQRLAVKHLRQSYQEKLDKIEERKDEALHFVHRIMTAATLDASEKESLLNQAIEELNDNLNHIVHSYRNEPVSKYALQNSSEA